MGTNKGLAMGTIFAPVYATLTIDYLEEKLYEELNTLLGNDFGMISELTL